MQKFTAKVAYPQHLDANLTKGTRLVERNAPPLNNASEYGKNDPEPVRFLGYVVHILGVPNWMSTYFARVMSEQDEPGAGISSYCSDWIEKIVYEPGLTSPVPAQKLAELNGAITLGINGQPGLCSGCMSTAPVAAIQQLGNPKPDQNEYYAIVSAADKNGVVSEITITDLKNRPAFVKSFLHKNRVKLTLDLRKKVPGIEDLLKRRRVALKAVKNLPNGFKP